MSRKGVTPVTLHIIHLWYNSTNVGMKVEFGIKVDQCEFSIGVTPLTLFFYMS